MSGSDVAVIGAGIVGLAVGNHLRAAGLRVTVIDRDPAGDKASFGNAGGIAVTEVVPASVPGLIWKVPGWLIDPLGPLAIRPRHAPKLLPWLWRFLRAGTSSEVTRIAAALAALNGRVYDDLLPMLAETGLAGELIHRGALTVYETEAGFVRDAWRWALIRSHGIVAENFSGDEARRMEPALGPAVTRGVFTPQWSHVRDPKRLVDGLRQWLLRNGVEIVAGEAGRIAARPGSPVAVGLGDGGAVEADRVVVAAGAWSGRLAASLGDRVLLESERGYNTTFPAAANLLHREVIFAERHCVATPLDCGLRIGGAAEFGGLEADMNAERSRALATLAARYLPGLALSGGTAWAGHRPATPDSLPVIGRSPRHSQVFYAFGHGHLGLTQAAATGRLVADLLLGRTPPIDMRPYGCERFDWFSPAPDPASHGP
jgi:D-amino-acid dehydrogenase